MIWDKLAEISTDYVFGGTRYDVYDTDCSGIVCGAFFKYLNIDPFDLGWWTGGMWVSPLLEHIWQGDSPELPWNALNEDDLIFTSTCARDFDSYNGSHVGLYTGNVEFPFLSHFCDGGPYITSVDGVYSGNERYFGVARLKGFNMDVWDDTSYQEPFPTGASMGTRLVYIDKFVNEIKDDVENLPDKIWHYNWEGTAPDGNMYNCVIQMRMMMQDLWQNRNKTIDMLEKVLDELKKIQLPEDDGR